MQNTMLDSYSDNSIKIDPLLIVFGILRKIAIIVLVALVFFLPAVCEAKIDFEMDMIEQDQGYTLGKYNRDVSHITVPSFYKGKPVTQIGNEAFAGCTMLTEVTIPDSVTSIGSGAFSGCIRLKNIRISNNVSNIGEGVFSGCTNLTSISVDSTNQFYRGRGNCIIDKTSGRLIAGCKRSVIPGGVTSIGKNAFYKCVGLSFIKIPGGVKNIEASAFYQSGLRSIKIPDSVTDIGNQAFAFCDSLIDINISAFVKSIGNGAFLGCPGLTRITVDPSNTKYKSEGNCLIETATNKLIAGCKGSLIPKSVTTVGDHAFYGCSGLASITIPVSVTNIESGAFVGCTALSDITFEGTKEQWRQIEKGNSWSGIMFMNNKILATMVHCSDGDVDI